MFKNIVPGLVSFETQLKEISGFYFSDNFDFYSQIEASSAFHYKIIVDNDIAIPKEYDFRSGYFFKLKNKWYYERKIAIFTLKFCFDLRSNTFSFNKLYSLIPFEIGHIFPVGRHIADLINLELFLEDYIAFKGCAFCYQNRNICIIAPGFNGKTSLTKSILDRGGKYIAEDIIVINNNENKIYPTNIRTDFFARKISHKIKESRIDKIIEAPKKIDELFLIQNSTNTKYVGTEKNIIDFLNLCSLSFLKNPFVRSYIFEENMQELLENKINQIGQVKSSFHFKNVKNFNFNFLD